MRLHAAAGAIGGVVSLAVAYPLYTVTTRIQTLPATQDPDEPGVLATMASIIQREGVQGLYSGLGAALFATTVQSAVYYYCFAWFKRVLRVTVRPAGNFGTAFLAGVATAAITNPLWVVNTRQITEGPRRQASAVAPCREARASPRSRRAPSPSPRLPTLSYAGTIAALYRTEGVAGFYAGLLPAVALAATPAVQVQTAAIASLASVASVCFGVSSCEHQPRRVPLTFDLPPRYRTHATHTAPPPHPRHTHAHTTATTAHGVTRTGMMM